MSPMQNMVFCTKTKFCFLIVLVILLAIILAASLRRKDEEADEGLKLAGKSSISPNITALFELQSRYTKRRYRSKLTEKKFATYRNALPVKPSGLFI